MSCFARTPAEPHIEIGPNAAFADPTYSSGSFLVDPGSYSITIQAIGQSFSSGRGYIRIRKASVPEPTSTLGFLALGTLGVANCKHPAIKLQTRRF